MSVVRFGKKASSHIAEWVEISEASGRGLSIREACVINRVLRHSKTLRIKNRNGQVRISRFWCVHQWLA